MRKGYIRPLGGQAAGLADTDAAAPYYLTAEDYLTPEQVNKLPKNQLLEYAGHIGCSGFKPNATTASLRKAINQYIEDAAVEDDPEEEDSSEE